MYKLQMIKKKEEGKPCSYKFTINYSRAQVPHIPRRCTVKCASVPAVTLSNLFHVISTNRLLTAYKRVNARKCTVYVT